MISEDDEVILSGGTRGSASEVKAFSVLPYRIDSWYLAKGVAWVGGPNPGLGCGNTQALCDRQMESDSEMWAYINTHCKGQRERT